MGRFSVHCVDGLEFVRSLPEASVDAVITDPPYNIGGKFIGRTDQADDGFQFWDKFSDDDAFIAFLRSYVVEFKRVIRPTGSLYMFSSPAFASRAEEVVREHFNVLNHVVWMNPSHGGGRSKKSELRRFWHGSERIIFAEHKRAERDYVNAKQRQRRTGALGDIPRRPFSVSADVPWDDVWVFKPARYGAGLTASRHPCEKPLPLIEHIVRSSTRPGDVILDPFCGSGSLGEAALLNGRVPVLNDMDKRLADAARLRCDNALKLVDTRVSLAVSDGTENFTGEDEEDGNDERAG